MCGFCEEEFLPTNLGFQHKRPILFATSSFGSKYFYPAWLFLQLIYYIGILVYDGNQPSLTSRDRSFLFVHNWVYIVLSLSHLVEFGVTVYVQCRASHIFEERQSTSGNVEVVMGNRDVKLTYTTMGMHYRMTWYMKLSWVLYTMSSTAGLAVSTLLAAYYYTTNAFGSTVHIIAHVSAVLIIVHVVISSKPFRILHVYLPVLFGLVYVTFTVLYQTQSNNFIYKHLDWNQTFMSSSISAAILFIYAPFAHFVLSCITELRRQCCMRIYLHNAQKKWQQKLQRDSKKVGDSNNVPSDVQGKKYAKHTRRHSKVHPIVPSCRDMHDEAQIHAQAQSNSHADKLNQNVTGGKTLPMMNLSDRTYIDENGDNDTCNLEEVEEV